MQKEMFSEVSLLPEPVFWRYDLKWNLLNVRLYVPVSIGLEVVEYACGLASDMMGETQGNLTAGDRLN